jgi:hypothetical protein
MSYISHHTLYLSSWYRCLSIATGFDASSSQVSSSPLESDQRPNDCQGASSSLDSGDSLSDELWYYCTAVRADPSIWYNILDVSWVLTKVLGRGAGYEPESCVKQKIRQSQIASAWKLYENAIVDMFLELIYPSYRSNNGIHHNNGK